MDNSQQIEFWNGQAGERWRDEASALDKLLSPFLGSIIGTLPNNIQGSVLDVGCGAGALSLAVAGQFGGARLVGVDVSQPMLSLARARAEAKNAKAEFIEADASSFQYHEPFSGLVSRFGVMFFEDPYAAFKHFHGQMTKGAPLAFACWRAAADNEWVMAPMMAALQFMDGPPPQPEPRQPGPFAFAEANYVTDILKSSGWRDVDVQPWDGKLEMPGDSVSESAEFSLGIGPLARLIAEQNIDHEKVKAALVENLSTRTGPEGTVELNAAAWIVTARA